MIIDATDLIAGRMATRVAKLALLGEKIDVINCEKAVITGNKSNILNKYKMKKRKGSHAQGPFISRRPEFFVRRLIRGMLPYKQSKGREAFKRIKCHIDIPDVLKNNKPETFIGANLKKLPNFNYISIEEICLHLGYKR